MPNAPSRTASAGTLEPSDRFVAHDFRVADLSLAALGRGEPLGGLNTFGGRLYAELFGALPGEVPGRSPQTARGSLALSGGLHL